MDDGMINQYLHELLGYSQPLIIEYVKGCAQSSKSTQEIANKLKDCGIQETEKSKQFIDQLYNALGIKDQLNDYQKKELQLLQKKKENESYEIIQEEEEDPKLLETDDPIVATIEALQKKGESNLSTEETAELKKLMQEKDKVERDALSKRIIERESNKKGILVV
jgi:hypothetical protein